MLPSALQGRPRPATITFVRLASLALCANLLPVAALGQIDPDDTGEGVRLGMSQEGNSGQAGTVTLFDRGANRTLVIVRVVSPPRAGGESARVARAPACGSGGRTAVFPLQTGGSGQFRGVVALATTRLLSGNYIVEVFARPGGARVSCGELHR